MCVGAKTKPLDPTDQTDNDDDEHTYTAARVHTFRASELYEWWVNVLVRALKSSFCYCLHTRHHPISRLKVFMNEAAIMNGVIFFLSFFFCFCFALRRFVLLCSVVGRCCHRFLLLLLLLPIVVSTQRRPINLSRVEVIFPCLTFAVAATMALASFIQRQR